MIPLWWMVVPVTAEGVVEPPNRKDVTTERKTESGHLNKDLGSAGIELGTYECNGHWIAKLERKAELQYRDPFAFELRYLYS